MTTLRTAFHCVAFFFFFFFFAVFVGELTDYRAGSCGWGGEGVCVCVGGGGGGGAGGGEEGGE